MPMSTTPTTSPTSVPRPLQLIDGNVPSMPGPSLILSPTRTVYPISPELPTPPATSRRPASANPRRQSSISYFPSDHVSELRSPTSPSGFNFRPSVRRSNSLGMKTGDTFALSGRTKGDRRSVGSENGRNGPPSPAIVERGPLTLTEKHADLLHFIAQKESKCLELRSQLAIHEEELSHLKRKWERIVSRGMDRAYTPSFPSTNMPYSASSSSSPSSSSHHPSPSLTSSLLSPGNGAVLDGIKEGVQGVGRLLAAGLELSGSSSSATPSSPSGFTTTSIGPGFSGVSRAAMTPALRRAKHENTQSVSSVSTSGTTSSSILSAGTRLSQSSASSLSFAEDEENHTLLERGVDETVHQGVAKENPVHAGRDMSSDMAVSPSTATKSTKMLRRRSREAPKENSTPSPSSTIVPQRTNSKRLSGNVVPAASMSGLGAAPVSSWMGTMGTTVGKKWEEIQKGETFTKSQKRASILISDVSQSIFAALASPTAPSQPPHSSRSLHPTSSPLSISTNANPFLATISLSSASSSPVPSAGSLLDDDELEAQDDMARKGLGEVLVPVSISPNPRTGGVTKQVEQDIAKAQPTSSLDDDDEWNW